MTFVFTAKRTLITAITSLTILIGGNAYANPLDGQPSGKYSVDPAHASVVWKLSHFGFSTYVGRFNQFSADIDLDTEDFQQSSVQVTINVDSLDTDYPYPEKEDFNAVLAEEWFKSKEHPSISFVSTSLSALDGQNFDINGNLTIMGQAHPVVLKARLNGATPLHPFTRVPLVGFSAKAEIDRTLWGIDRYAPKIGAIVTVEIEGEFLKNPQ